MYLIKSGSFLIVKYIPDINPIVCVYGLFMFVNYHFIVNQ